jgi:hypothetical protein
MATAEHEDPFCAYVRLLELRDSHTRHPPSTRNDALLSVHNVNLGTCGEGEYRTVPGGVENEVRVAVE